MKKMVLRMPLKNLRCNMIIFEKKRALPIKSGIARFFGYSVSKMLNKIKPTALIKQNRA